MNKKKLIFIINPISGVGKQKTVEKLTKSLLNGSVFDYEFKYTQYSGHATILASEAINEGAKIVVAVGGDGTVNEIAKSLINTDTFLAIVPTGSGNGIARHLKIPVSIKKSILKINLINHKRIDTATINDRPFVMLAGCGIDASIAKQFAKLSSRGLLGYIKLIIKNIISYKPQDYIINIDDKIFSHKAYLLTVANCSQFGNNAYIAPMAKEDDQLLNITLIKVFSFYKIIPLLFRLFFKTIHLSNVVNVYSGKKIIITQKDNFAQIDGEFIETGNQLTIEINPLSLTVLV